jgi:hypothetical protein
MEHEPNRQSSTDEAPRRSRGAASEGSTRVALAAPSREDRFVVAWARQQSCWASRDPLPTSSSPGANSRHPPRPAPGSQGRARGARRRGPRAIGSDAVSLFLAGPPGGRCVRVDVHSDGKVGRWFCNCCPDVGRWPGVSRPSVRSAITSPAAPYRTVRAVLPHTALRHRSSSGMRQRPRADVSGESIPAEIVHQT